MSWIISSSFVGFVLIFSVRVMWLSVMSKTPLNYKCLYIVLLVHVNCIFLSVSTLWLCQKAITIKNNSCEIYSAVKFVSADMENLLSVYQVINCVLGILQLHSIPKTRLPSLQSVYAYTQVKQSVKLGFTLTSNFWYFTE